MMDEKDIKDYHKLIKKLEESIVKKKKELEPIGILKRGRTSWAMDVNFRFPRGESNKFKQDQKELDESYKQSRLNKKERDDKKI
jgi:hypothetical protein